LVVADAIVVVIFQTRSAANIDGIENIAVAVTVAFGNVGTSAFINGSRAVANTTVVEEADAVIYIIAKTIVIFIGAAIASTFTNSISVEAVIDLDFS
jgi:hypothetical protein